MYHYATRFATTTSLQTQCAHYNYVGYVGAWITGLRETPVNLVSNSIDSGVHFFYAAFFLGLQQDPSSHAATPMGESV